MDEQIRDLTAAEEPCVYLPGQRARLHYRYIEGCKAETYQEMLERGWRRFGRGFFRPECQACAECRSLRVSVEDFQPDRSMRRTARRNRDLRVQLARPGVTPEHLELYHRYHADMSERKQWPSSRSGPLDYFHTFVEGYEEFGYELRFRLRDELLGVALVDLLPRALSAVYCYYAPEQRQRGLGVFSVLQQVALARQLQRPRVYLGFLVEGNASMRYKARYRPYELLSGRPSFDAAPTWALPVEVCDVPAPAAQPSAEVP